METLDFEHLPAVVAKPRREEPSSDSLSVPRESVPRESPLSSVLERPEFAAFGSVVRSSPAVRLTEAETEYAVWVRKHVFSEHVVLEFDIENTIEGQVMTDVSVRLALHDGDAARWTPLLSLPAPCIPWGQAGTCFAALRFDPAGGVPEAAFGATVQFVAKDVEEDELDAVDAIEGFAEEYPVEDVLLGFPDFVGRPAVSDFRGAWSEAGEEAVEKATLPFEDVETAVKQIVEVMGLAPMEGSERVPVGVGVCGGCEVGHQSYAAAGGTRAGGGVGAGAVPGDSEPAVRMCAEDRGAEPGCRADADGVVAGAVNREKEGRKEWIGDMIRKDCLFGRKGKERVFWGVGWLNDPLDVRRRDRK